MSETRALWHDNRGDARRAAQEYANYDGCEWIITSLGGSNPIYGIHPEDAEIATWLEMEIERVSPEPR